MNEHVTKNLICASDGSTLFVGTVYCDYQDFAEEAEDGYAVIHDARVVSELNVPTPQGIVAHVRVKPHGFCLGPCNVTIHVHHFFFPKDEDAKILEELIALAEKTETANRAQRSGLSVVGQIPAEPPNKGLS